VTPEIHCFDDLATLYAKGAAMFAQTAAESLRVRGTFSVALAGGSTPRGLYSLMADDPQLRSAIPWPRIDFFWGDERHVPPEHPDSNYKMAYEAMLSKVPATPERVHRVRAENPDATVAAAQYESEIRTSLAAPASVPRLDLVHLGMGTDGHTASLFPGTQALNEQKLLAVANWVERVHAYRITMTLPLLDAARLILIVAAGEEKAKPVRDALQPSANAPPLPVQLVRPQNGRIVWLLDRAAASLLTTTPES
jgi:6-phosphogluconolactonase